MAREKGPGHRRVEIRFRLDDQMLTRLEHEAEARGVELQQHIYDVLRGRYMIQCGESIYDLLWLPSTTPAPNTTEQWLPSASDQEDH